MLLPHLFDNPDGFPQNSGNQENSEQAPKPNSSKNKNTLERLLDTLKGKKEEKKKGEQEKRTDTGQRPVDSPKAKIQEALSKAVEEKIQEDQKTPEDRSLEEFITKTRNLDPKTHKDQLNQIKQEIQQQKQLEQLIKKLTDSQGRNVYDRIVNEIFSKIVQTHKLPQIYEKSPRPFSEGGQFDAQSLA
ncbi:MAG: hypothetical protein LBD11_03880 [Candidatus Peribacteria bacterium]|jgi:hypothetical protein|nr:hypothetical protein [Candidatus Peribacteria bacterium]